MENITEFLSSCYDNTLNQGYYSRAEILIVIQSALNLISCVADAFRYPSSQRLGRELLCHPKDLFRAFLISSNFYYLHFCQFTGSQSLSLLKIDSDKFPFPFTGRNMAGLLRFSSSVRRGQECHTINLDLRPLIQSQKQQLTGHET